MSADARADDIVASLDLDQKVRLLSGRTFWMLEPLPDHGLESIQVADGPHGLRCQVATGDHLGVSPAVPATCFPTAAALGSSWDIELLEQVGVALGEEAAALGVSVVLGPGLNIKRHPAGGRSFEYLSEDPHLGGHLAAAMVRGIQSQGVGTSVKHYAANNQESHRMTVDAVVDERTLREIYLAGFEIVVTEAAPWTVMCSYNKLNGTYASEHHELLTTILREEWGYDGLVVSDWGAVSDRVAGIAAGLDLEMPTCQGALDGEVIDAVRDGRLEEAAVDACARRVVELIQRGQAARRADRTANFADHRALARRAAAAGSVLLTNNGVLPLQDGQRLAVIGEFAMEPRYQGAGSSQVTPLHLESVHDALIDRVGADFTYARGFSASDGETTDQMVDDAVRAATGADVAVVFAGLPAKDESEGFDRDTLDLPSGQVRVIEAVAATATPVVVVLSNGGVVHLPWSDRVDAVLECWLGGETGGPAAVDVLFGDAEPGGRLAESIPEHVGQLPADRNFPGEPRQVQYREGLYVGYRFHDSAGVPARFAFGEGLSYTSFEWSDISIDGEGTDLRVDVTVTNTGDRPGSDVVQIYVRDPESSVHRPHQELKGFAKVHLAPGASQTVSIALDRRSFAVWDVASHGWLVEAGEYHVVVARSSVRPETTLKVELDSDDVVTPVEGPASFVADDEEFVRLLGGPVPPVPPARPFNRNSTLEEIAQTRLGRLLAGVVISEAQRRAAHEFPDPDEATREMVRRAVLEGPTRSLVLMSGGAVTMPQLDAIIAALNGRWGTAVGHLRGGTARLPSDRAESDRAPKR